MNGILKGLFLPLEVLKHLNLYSIFAERLISEIYFKIRFFVLFLILFTLFVLILSSCRSDIRVPEVTRSFWRFLPYSIMHHKLISARMHCRSPLNFLLWHMVNIGKILKVVNILVHI
jgi:hypothetical protein